LHKKGLTYSFYQINEDFSINLDALEQQMTDFKAVYFINYFGFQHSSVALKLIREYQEYGAIIIEDNCQAGFVSHWVGDFVFCSMRKFLACDGGYMATRNNLSPLIQSYINRQNHRLPFIRSYRKQLPAYLFDGLGSRSALERLFYQAEAFYEGDCAVIGDLQEREKIEHLDWQAIRNIRRKNYNALLELIAEIPTIQPIFPALQPDNMPMGMPVYLNGPNRDQILEALADESISLTVHWDALLTDTRANSNPQTLKMASNILTLPVDQYTSLAQLEYMADRLNWILNKYDFTAKTTGQN